MSRTQPYLPLLLRILHNVNALLVLGAIVSGFLVYNSYDGRFGKLPIPPIDEIIDIHGTIAVCFFFLIPVFALYSFHAGQRRLIQPDTLPQLTQANRPAWWFSLHRLTNTLMLLAATFAAITGRMMDEDWLEDGQLGQIWYSGHLLAWLVMVLCLALHWLMIVKVGGVPLLLAMASVRFRSEDSPAQWPSRLQRWVKQVQGRS